MYPSMAILMILSPCHHPPSVEKLDGCSKAIMLLDWLTVSSESKGAKNRWIFGSDRGVILSKTSRSLSIHTFS